MRTWALGFMLAAASLSTAFADTTQRNFSPIKKAGQLVAVEDFQCHPRCNTEQFDCSNQCHIVYTGSQLGQCINNCGRTATNCHNACK